MNRRTLPDPCTQLMSMGAWLCGSAVAWVEGSVEQRPNDIDIMVPPEKWLAACRLLRAAEYDARINRMGGLKIRLETLEGPALDADLVVTTLDVWPGTVESFLDELTVRTDKIRLIRYRPYMVLEIST